MKSPEMDFALPALTFLPPLASSSRLIYFHNQRYKQSPFVVPSVLSLQIDLHVHCEDWDRLLSSGVWEPMVIVKKIPEFLAFVKEVQGLAVNEVQRNELAATSKQSKGHVKFMSVNLMKVLGHFFAARCLPHQE